jgi:hypothetical protein
MSIPQELIERRQWCCWKEVDGQKMPITPSGGTFRSNDPATFADFDEVQNASSQIAYVIQPDDPYTGIDLDNCLDEKGMLRPWAIPIVSRLDGLGYAEISPSGRGIKFTTKASKVKGSRCVVKFGDKKQQMEVYDFNRFWTITKNVYAGNTTIGDGQKAVDWICKTHLMDEKPGNLDGFKVQDEPESVFVPLDERARQYVDAAQVPGEGDRNNAAFRLAGNLLAMEDESGRRLSLGQVEELVVAWNARNPDPLPEKELKSAVSSASKNGSQRPPKPPEKRVEVTREPIAQQPTIPKELMRPPGMIEQIIDYTLRTSLYPQPELALAGAIALMGTITGRKITDNYGTRTNVYVLGLAPSGSGKEQARKTNKVLLTKACGEKMLGPERIASSAGMVTSIANQPSLLFQLDEIGRMLSTLKSPGKAPHLYNIATILMQIYGSSDCIWIGDAYADAKKTQKIDQPHPVIYGTSVPAGFWESLTAENVSDGLLGRMMPFESSAGYVDPQTPEAIEPPGELIDAVRWWVELKTGGNMSDAHPAPFCVEYTQDAQERFHEHMVDIARKRKKDEEQAAALWSRSAGKAGKLALIFAASRCPMTTLFRVEFEDIDRAIALSNWLTRTIQKQVFEHVSVNDQEDRTKRVLRLLGTPMTKSQLTRRTQWLKKRERDEILDTLIEAGLVRFRTEDTDGALKTTYSRSV